jgi:hypothetical protein
VGKLEDQRPEVAGGERVATQRSVAQPGMPPKDRGIGDEARGRAGSKSARRPFSSATLPTVADHPSNIADAVQRLLRTGQTDPHCAAWPGSGFLERANRAHDDLGSALVHEVRQLAEGQTHEPLPQADTVVGRWPAALPASRWS